MKKTTKQMKQEFNACITTCSSLLRSSKALYQAEFIEDAVEHVADAYMYAGLALNILMQVEDETNLSIDLEADVIN
jgi:predicted DNA-binding protein